MPRTYALPDITGVKAGDKWAVHAAMIDCHGNDVGSAESPFIVKAHDVDLALSGKAYFASTGEVKQALGQNLRILFRNPVSSTKRAVITAIIVTSTAGTVFAALSVNPTTGLPTAAKNVKNTVITPTNQNNLSQCQLLADAGSTPLDSGSPVTQVGVVQGRSKILEGAFVIQPGASLGLNIPPFGLAGSVEVTIYFSEA